MNKHAFRWAVCGLLICIDMHFEKGWILVLFWLVKGLCAIMVVVWALKGNKKNTITENLTNPEELKTKTI